MYGIDIQANERNLIANVWHNRECMENNTFYKMISFRFNFHSQKTKRDVQTNIHHAVIGFNLKWYCEYFSPNVPELWNIWVNQFSILAYSRCVCMNALTGSKLRGIVYNRC